MHDSDLGVDEARRIARDAFVYGFAFMANYRVFIRNAVARAPICWVGASTSSPTIGM